MRDLFNQKEFPVWEGYNYTDEKIKTIKTLWLNDINLMAKTIHEVILEKEYYRNMLLYIQRKLYLDEPLNICLNSANEIHDIMMSPCKIINNEGKELTLYDYDDIEEWTIERENNNDPMSRQYMLCKICDFVTDNYFEFDKHKCDLDED